MVIIEQTDRHPFNGLFSRTTWVSRHQKGKPFWILLEQEMTGWQWHQLGHMQIICTSLQTDNHASISPLNFFTDQMLFLTPNQQCQSTEGSLEIKLECGPMPNVMAALPNIGGALCSTFQSLADAHY